MTPIERVARVLWENSLLKPYRPADTERALMATPEPEPDWQRFVPLARAVLEAIREPSDRMVHVVIPELGTERMGFKQSWQAMIDAALEEGV
jgi:hypothetical protein